MPVSMVIRGERVPIKSWCPNPDSNAIEQAKHAAALPFVHHHVCMMPDVHLGYGICVGGVFATEGVIVPNAVGVDIGCGMIAVNTHIPVSELTTDVLKTIIMTHIRKTVPVGFNKQDKMQDESLMPSLLFDKEHLYPDWEENLTVVKREYNNARLQLGSLGGGNHFCEIQKDESDIVWIMLHSGSRNLGKQVCNHYDKIAKELNKKWASSIPPSWELAFLPIDHPAAQDYIREMTYCVEWAFANRMLMMKNIFDAFALAGFKPETFDKPINISHNWAALETHYGKEVWVHRKGATRAFAGELGIIPGSQGTASFIVEGLGNRESFQSCSHGAGRKMGRAEAKRQLNLAEEIKKMDGIVHGIRTVAELDEAPGCYKDIDTVMAEQSDLVKIRHRLLPIAVIKG